MIFCLLSSAAFALDADALDIHIQSFGYHWGEAHRFNGHVLVYEDGEVLFSKGYGLADRGQGTVPGPDTTFRIGSLTRQFTASAVLKLEEQGKLTVQDPVTKHLTFPHEVTLHQVLMNSSGVWNYSADPSFEKSRAGRAHTTDELVSWFGAQPLDFEPGSRSATSNSGYVLAGAVIEAVTGRPWDEAMNDLLFAPAGLQHTGARDDLSTDAALPYTVRKEKLVPATDLHMSAAHAAGGLRSTSSDLIRWHQALQKAEVLSPDTIEKLFNRGRPAMGMGDDVQPLCNLGATYGFSTSFCRVPERDLAVVVWTNNDRFPITEVNAAAVNAAIGKPMPSRLEMPIVSPDKKLMKEMTGTWLLSDDAKYSLTRAGAPPYVFDALASIDLSYHKGLLTLAPVGRPPVTLQHAEGGVWFTRQAQILAWINEEGFFLNEKGYRLSFVREE